MGFIGLIKSRLPLCDLWFKAAVAKDTVYTVQTRHVIGMCVTSVTSKDVISQGFIVRTSFSSNTSSEYIRARQL